MFKEAFPSNFRDYEHACKSHEIVVGKMFVTETGRLSGPRWIINFPTKKHWRHPSKLEWIVEGLKDLRHVIEVNNIRSIALPPLGAGNGGLDWREVRPEVEKALGDLKNVDVLVYEPTDKYQNVAKRTGVQSLTPARVLIAEMIRRYNGCSGSIARTSRCRSWDGSLNDHRNARHQRPAQAGFQS